MTFTRLLHYTFSITGMIFMIVCPSVIMGQDSQTFFVDAAFQRFNMREFDMRISEPNFKNRILCDNWCDSEVITVVDTANIKFNIDLAESSFYVNINNRVLLIRNDFIKSFVLENKTYINYLLPESSKTMILELLVDGNFALYRHHDLVYHPPNFNVILNVGNKEGFYKKRYDHYVYCNGQLHKIPSKPKKASRELQEKCDIPSIKNTKGSIEDLFLRINEPEK